MAEFQRKALLKQQQLQAQLRQQGQSDVTLPALPPIDLKEDGTQKKQKQQQQSLPPGTAFSGQNCQANQGTAAASDELFSGATAPKDESLASNEEKLSNDDVKRISDRLSQLAGDAGVDLKKKQKRKSATAKGSSPKLNGKKKSNVGKVGVKKTNMAIVGDGNENGSKRRRVTPPLVTPPETPFTSVDSNGSQQQNPNGNVSSITVTSKAPQQPRPMKQQQQQGMMPPPSLGADSGPMNKNINTFSNNHHSQNRMSMLQSFQNMQSRNTDNSNNNNALGPYFNNAGLMLPPAPALPSAGQLSVGGSASSFMTQQEASERELLQEFQSP
jgi:hypothetical protein